MCMIFKRFTVWLFRIAFKLKNKEEKGDNRWEK